MVVISFPQFVTLRLLPGKIKGSRSYLLTYLLTYLLIQSLTYNGCKTLWIRGALRSSPLNYWKKCPVRKVLQSKTYTRTLSGWIFGFL